MIHKKVSEMPENPDPTIVGSTDWNEPHVYSIGEIWPIAYQAFGFDPSGHVTTSTDYGGRTDNWVDWESAGVYYFFLNLDDLPVATGSEIEYKVHLSAMPRGALPTNWRFEAAVGNGPEGEDYCYIRVYNAAGAPADLTIKVDFNVTVYAALFGIGG